jgi:Uma2 family endonuclease
MSPLLRHWKIVDLLVDLIKALLRHQQQDWDAFRLITLKRDAEQGVEPDYSFYVQNRHRILAKDRFDLAIDPPPDLALEVDLTSLTRPEDYVAIAPVELWLYRQNELRIYGFEGRTYRELDRSLMFPDWDLKALMPVFVERGWQAGSSVTVREFEAYLAQA